MYDKGGRYEALRAFMDLEGSKVEHSARGRLLFLKHRANQQYLRDMRNSKFALCPNQKDWSGPKEKAWTYRFAEAVLNGAIPVVFRDLPLGQDFTEGFHVVDSIDSLTHDLDETTALRMQRENLTLALSRFTL